MRHFVTAVRMRACQFHRLLLPTCVGASTGQERRAGVAPAPGGFASALSHAFGGLGGSSLAHLLLDAGAHLGVDILPVLEGTAQHRLAHAAQQAASHLVYQLAALFFIEDLASQNAGLPEIVVILAETIGAAHHLPVGFPAIFHRAAFIRPGAAAAVGSIDRCVAAVVVGHLAV